MINVLVLYPNKEGGKFDMDYYLGKHIPMLKKLLGPALRQVIVEKGVSGPAPGTRAEFMVLCHLRFESLDTFFAAFGPHAETIQKDVANYSSIEPIVQINELTLT